MVVLVESYAGFHSRYMRYNSRYNPDCVTTRVGAWNRVIIDSRYDSRYNLPGERIICCSWYCSWTCSGLSVRHTPGCRVEQFPFTSDQVRRKWEQVGPIGNTVRTSATMWDRSETGGEISYICILIYVCMLYINSYMYVCILIYVCIYKLVYIMITLFIGAPEFGVALLRMFAFCVWLLAWSEGTV